MRLLDLSHTYWIDGELNSHRANIGYRLFKWNATITYKQGITIFIGSVPTEAPSFAILKTTTN